MRIPWRLVLLKRRLLYRWEGEGVLLESFQRTHGRPLDLSNPRTFSEKLFKRMIMVHRHRNPTFTRLADKVLVRDHVASRLGPQYLVKLFWHGPDPRRIPFDRLPAPCMIKTNHDAGGNIVFERPADERAIARQLRKWLRNDHYFVNREYHYHDIPRQVIVEEYLDDGAPDGPLDYRFWCFHGKPVLIQVDNRRHSINPFYSTDWVRERLSYRPQAVDADIPRPSNLAEMLACARKLSAEFDFVRVDFYSVHGRTYFGELTFTPVAGQAIFDPPEWDLRLGELWRLPDERNESVGAIHPPRA